MKPRHHVPIRMTDEEHAALKYLAQRDKKRSASAWVRDAIAAAVEGDECSCRRMPGALCPVHDQGQR